MRLSRREELLLRRIDAGLQREDPSLARRLAELTPADDRPAVSWRPARCAVVIVSVTVAAAVFLLALVVLTFQPPCTRTAAVQPSAASSAMESSAAPSARSSAPVSGGTRAAPAPTFPSEPSRSC